MSHFITLLGATSRRLALALLLTTCAIGCGGGEAPTAPTPAVTSIPTPTPSPAPTTSGTIFGVVFEMTAAGRTLLEGVRVQLLSCAVANCPSASSVFEETTTDEDGAYRVSGLHNGGLNFLWVLKEGYVADGPLPSSCDWCDRIVMVSGDTQLDVELVRR